MVLFMPGTTPGIFIFVVFGTTASSRKKLVNLLIPKSWRESPSCCFGRRKSRSSTPDPLSSGEGGITVKRSLTVTSTSRLRAGQVYDDDFSEPSMISMDDLTRRSDGTRSVHVSYMKPLPLTPGSPPTSRFNTPTKDSSSRGGTSSNVRELTSIEEKNSVGGGALTRTNTDDSLRVPDIQGLGAEHSDDSGPILPIQGHDVRLSRDMFTLNREGSQKTVLSANLLVSHFSGSIYSLSLNTSNGKGQLAITSTLRAGGLTPSWLTLDSATGNLYVTDEAQYGAPVLTTLKVNNDNSVQLVSTAPTSGGGVHSSLYGGSDGRGFFAVAEYNPSTITTYKLPLSASSQQVQKLAFNMSAPGPDPYRQDKPHPHSVFTDPTGRFLLSADLGADLVRIFSIDASTGQLTNCPAAATGAGDGPRHGEFWKSPSGSLFLYIVNELAGSVTAWAVTTPPSAAGAGCLSLSKIQSIPTYPPGKTPPAGSKTAEVRVWGSFVYATNRNDQSFGSQQDSAATLAIDPATGRLSFVEATNTHTYFPRTFAVNKAGDAVAYGGQTSSTVVVVARNVSTGRLGGVVAQLQVGAPGTVNNEDGLSAVVWDE
ncbi:hypothetical protein SLS63_013826 [Diaporthe eres]|uniref:6-phosphogluconolactonase n=1 Tax=Diaporthe eres TaxID=83184 RepID=A0ABR1NMC8_DIAER